MKTFSVAEAQSDIESVLDSAQKETVVVTRAGKPSAVIVGVESYDNEELALASSPEFWRMVEDRRKGRSISLAQLKKQLRARERKAAIKPANGRRQGHRKSRRPKA